MDECSRWIWISDGAGDDIYGEFLDKFEYTGGDAALKISADSNYAVYINGEYVFSGQYPDFPHYKVYDEIDITRYCRPGENRLAIEVWHYGRGSMGYYPGRAALRFEVHLGNVICCCSHVKTLSRKSPAYVNGLMKNITSQLGLSFKYNIPGDDGWRKAGGAGFKPSELVAQKLPMHKRPVARPALKPAVASRLIGGDGKTHFLYDLGREEAGFITVRLQSPHEQDILIAYGEHIVDGGVRRLIGARDFSVEIRVKPGMNEYFNPFRRLGGRYLEVFSSEPIYPELISLMPVEYPLKKTAVLPPMDELQRRIYDVSVRTLELCMHEHYEDTPWREQALYAMDSRNQMLCGYYAFGEYEFPRANLYLMSRDRRSDGLLSICTPSRDDLTIPSFSLHYFTEVWEYTKYSGDLTLAREIWDKLESLLSAFSRRVENGLVPVFEEKCHWNFYEWAEGLSGRLFGVDEKRFDTALNCLYSMALQSMQKLADALGCPAEYATLARATNRAIYEKFYDGARGVFANSTEDASASELANALAILSGAIEGREAAALAEILAAGGGSMTPATLSMLCFKYDALIKTDSEKYRQYVLDDISARYRKMLDQGATSFWETEKGERDFDNAGSLCHGWSAMPVYYYHTLLK